MRARLPTLSTLSIRRLLALWASVSLLALIIIGVTSFVSSQFIFNEQEQLSRTALPIEVASRELNRTVTDLVARQARILSARNLQEIDAVPSRRGLEGKFENQMQRLNTLVPKTDDMVQVLNRLERSYRRVLRIDTEVSTTRRHILELRQELVTRAREIEVTERDIQNTAEAIAGRINLATSRNKHRIREMFKAGDRHSALVSGLVTDTLFGNQASIQKAGADIRYGVLSVVSLTRAIMQEDNHDALISLRENRIQPQVSLIRSALDSLERNLAGNDELLNLTRKLRQDFSRLLSQAVESEQSAYQLRLRSIAPEHALRALQAESGRALADMTASLSQLSYGTSRISDAAMATSHRVGHISRLVVFSVSILLLLTMVVLIAIINRRISGPLETLRGAMHDIARGNLSRRLDDSNRVQDEFADLAVDFNRAATKAQTLIKELADAKGQLETTEARTRAILDGVPDGIITLDLSGHVIATNPAADLIFGALGEVLAGRHFAELLAETDDNDLERYFPEPGETPPGHMSGGREVLGQRLDGSPFPMWLSVSNSGGGQQRLYICVVSDITAYREAEVARHKSEALFRTIYENLPVMIAGFDKDGGCVLWNRELERNLGWTMQDVASEKRILERLYPDAKDRTRILRLMSAGDGVFREFSPTARDGGRQTHLWANFVLSDGMIISAGYDITGRKQIEEQLKTTTSELDTILQNALVGIAFVREGHMIHVNLRLNELFGLAGGTLEGNPVSNLFRDADTTRKLADETVFAGEFKMQRHDGSDFWCALSIKAINETAPDHGSIWIFEDITQRRMTEEQLRRMANYDVLTELPNRSLFHDRLRHAIHHASRRNQKLALLFLDLDHFKHINDSLGHSAGDDLLCDVARRLSRCIRQDDTVARLGGDEFTIILETIEGTNDAALVAQKIINVLASSYTLDGHEINISPSIGISVFPDDAVELDGLLRSADAAMYHAKACGRNTYQFYSDELNAAASERVKLMSSLRKAVDQNAFSLVYQPLVNIDDERIFGFEALLRWQHPEWGMVSPDRFIPLLEETGMIVPVGLWVLRKACEDGRDFFNDDIKLSVNLSGRQFRDAALPQHIAAIIEDTGVAPERLELEITETVLMSDTENAVQAMDRLHDLGVRLSIDDFGTGYSSLAYLKRFPIDTVKVDRSFIRDISTDADDAAIVLAILAMTHRLGLEAIAEGVETTEQLAFLHKNHCDYAQGFLFSKPVPASEAAKLLAQPGNVANRVEGASPRPVAS